MKTPSSAVLIGALLSARADSAAVHALPRDVDTRFPYTSPDVPVGGWMNPTVKGNGKGFPRLVEPPAVNPHSSKPSNNVNVISLAYIPQGVKIHYQTPFGLSGVPSVHWGRAKDDFCYTAVGQTRSYNRTPSCSQMAVTPCGQHSNDVQIPYVEPKTTYNYHIPASNGTTASHVLSFKTARDTGHTGSSSVAVLNNMGYTNAQGAHKQLVEAVDDGLAFAWHGGDISYADDWYSGILLCESDWPWNTNESVLD